jgi:hypothetical protein
VSNNKLVREFAEAVRKGDLQSVEMLLQRDVSAFT